MIVVITTAVVLTAYGVVRITLTSIITAIYSPVLGPADGSAASGLSRSPLVAACPRIATVEL